MEWARSNTTRAVVVGGLIVFIVVKAAAGDWAWVIVSGVLLMFNLILWRSYRAERSADRHRLPPPYGQVPQPGPVPLSPVETDESVDLLLSELLDRSTVAVAWSQGPAVWRQVSYLHEGTDLELSAAEVADYVWVQVHDEETVRMTDAHWSIAVGDELKPLLDLDVEEDVDPLLVTLLGHPAVSDAYHADREQYEVMLRSPMTLDEMAVLAAQALIAHHQDAVRRNLGG